MVREREKVTGVTAWILGPPTQYVAAGSQLTLQCR